MDALSTKIAEIKDRDVDQIAPLTGGCVGELFRIWLADGESVVAKTGQPGDPLDVEGWMLEYLGEHSTLPVPEVYLSRDSLLVMSYIDGEDALSTASEIHAAELLAALHDVTADDFGLDRDTVIGGIHQPNGLFPSWVEFFRDKRMLYMADEAERAGNYRSRREPGLTRWPPGLPSSLKSFPRHPCSMAICGAAIFWSMATVSPDSSIPRSITATRKSSSRLRPCFRRSAKGFSGAMASCGRCGPIISTSAAICIICGRC
jgi:hypothetical protein